MVLLKKNYLFAVLQFQLEGGFVGGMTKAKLLHSFQIVDAARIL